jgi:FixJ family two-component response regulator
MSNEQIELINEKYPINWLIDLVDDNEAVVMVIEDLLDLNGLKNRRKFDDPVLYEEELRNNPGINPHICIFDHLLKSRLTGLDLTIMMMKRNKECKIIMISGLRDPDVIEAFYDAGGYKWVNKDRQDFQPILIDRVQGAIEFLKCELERRHKLDQLDKPILRNDRRPLLKEDEKSI